MQQNECPNQNHDMCILFVCLNKQCKSSRLCCLQCEELHNDHSNQLVDFLFIKLFYEGNRVLDENFYNNMQPQVLQDIRIELENIKADHEYLKYQYEERYLNHKAYYSKCECHNNLIEGFFNKTENTLQQLQYYLKNLIDCQCDLISQKANQYLKIQKYATQTNLTYVQGISTDGTRITFRTDDEVQIIDFRTQQLLKTEPIFRLKLFRNIRIAVSKNHQYIAFSSEQTLKIYNINQKVPYFQIPIGMDEVEITFSQDNRFVVFMQYHKLIVWSLVLKKKIHQLEKINQTNVFPFISEDNKFIGCLIQSVYPYISIIIWDLKSGQKIITQFLSEIDSLKAFCTSKDFQTIISTDSKVIKIWKLKYSDNDQQGILQEMLKIDLKYNFQDNAMRLNIEIMLSPDEKYIFLLLNNFLWIDIIEIESGKTIQKLQFGMMLLNGDFYHFEFGYLYFNKDMNIFITGSSRVNAKIWKGDKQNELQ